jgi:hypothetical protein
VAAAAEAVVAKKRRREETGVDSPDSGSAAA